MVDMFFESAKKEHARLKVELEKSPIYLRLKLLEGIISTYDNPSMAKTRIENNPNGEPSYKSQRDKIEGYSLECIKLNSNKATMQQIHEHLASKGIKVKQNTLSAYLSMGKERMNTTYNGQTKEWSAS